MKVLQVYNQYRSLFGGEEVVVRKIGDLVEKAGGEQQLLLRSSRGLERSLNGKLRAFFAGIYNPFAYREMLRVLDGDRPDVAHVHNLYPLFSPSVVVALRRAGVPVVMTVHNHFLSCPTTAHLYRDQICEKCVGGREYHCVFQNCRENFPESLGYAIRSLVARKLRLFADNVTLAVAVSDFSRARLIRAGFEADRVVTLPNMVHLPMDATDPGVGRNVLFSGRLSPEKGVPTLLAASRVLPDIPVHFAGGGPILETVRPTAPSSVTFLGQLSSQGVAESYREARFLVVPSQCFEGCPLVIIEAMSHGLPVIASRIGGLPELVEDGETGLLFESGNADDLASKMRYLWDKPDLCRKMGSIGRGKAMLRYGQTAYWSRLSEIYQRAIAMCLT